MEIRIVNQNDDLLEISNIYESSWKYAYKNIIPQEYLDSIPAGRWANKITKDGMISLVLLEDEHIIALQVSVDQDGNSTVIMVRSFQYTFCRNTWEKVMVNIF